MQDYTQDKIKATQAESYKTLCLVLIGILTEETENEESPSNYFICSKVKRAVRAGENGK